MTSWASGSEGRHELPVRVPVLPLQVPRLVDMPTLRRVLDALRRFGRQS